ncbi:MAG: RluA family pseudouridine synthase [Planctomycetes bacterium]|nr:RluA family pseudouridine synthase [Planctomycetota bacterium]
MPDASRGERLDRFLSERLPWRSRTGVQKLIREGAVFLLAPGARAADLPPCTRAATRLFPPLFVEVRIEPKVHAAPADETPIRELRVLYEDEWIVALDKPAPLTVHPAGRHQGHTLINLLHQRYRRPEDPARDVVPKLAHRLDRETSGLLLVSKDDDVRHLLGEQFEQRRVAKAYLAIVEGSPAADRGEIDLPLAPAQNSAVRLKIAICARGEGQSALTHYEVLERGRTRSLIAAYPRTGRQHQIRVHLAAIGHPIVGDKIYGADEQLFLRHLAGDLKDEERERLGCSRHALHSWKLRFHHPKLDREMELECPLAEELRDLLR